MSERGPTFERRPLTLGDARGDAWRVLTDEERGLFERWVRTGTVEDGEVLKEGDVFRHGELLVKFSPPSGWPFGLRLSPARRSGRKHARLAWLPVPEPVIALDGCGPENRGLLVMRFVEGRGLHEVGLDEPEALHAFADYLARMHAAGVHHGDLHPLNLLWDKEQWWLLDLDAVRGGAHLLLADRLRVRQWARLAYTLPALEPLRFAFECYFAQAPLGTDVEAAWQRILATAERMRNVRDRRLAEPT